MTIPRSREERCRRNSSEDSKWRAVFWRYVFSLFFRFCCFLWIAIWQRFVSLRFFFLLRLFCFWGFLLCVYFWIFRFASLFLLRVCVSSSLLFLLLICAYSGISSTGRCRLHCVSSNFGAGICQSSTCMVFAACEGLICTVVFGAGTSPSYGACMCLQHVGLTV